MQQDLAKIFDQAAQLYELARPHYPQELYNQLQRETGLNEKSRILEIGCGTGQSTADLIRFTKQITCIEPGKNLIKIAKQKFPALTFFSTKFEDYKATTTFDLIVCATAWHWLDPEIRYRKSYQLLNKNGKLAVFYHFHIENDPDSFHSRANHIYAKYLGDSRDLASRDQIEERRSKMTNKYFRLIDLVEVSWQQAYSVNQYLQLRNTYSDHISIAEKERQAFEEEIRNFANQEFSGKITKSYTSVLFLAEKKY